MKTFSMINFSCCHFYLYMGNNFVNDFELLWEVEYCPHEKQLAIPNLIFSCERTTFTFSMAVKSFVIRKKKIKKDHLKNVAFLSYLGGTRCNRTWPTIILLFVIEKRQIKMKTKKKNENEIICFPQKCWWTITI
jgi:amino acid permease